MSKVAPPATAQSSLRKPGSSRAPNTSTSAAPPRQALASASASTPFEQRKPSLRTPGQPAALVTSKRTPAATKALPSTLGSTARKASGSARVDGAAASVAPVARRARRSSSVASELGRSTSGQAALSRSTSGAAPAARPPPAAVASKRSFPSSTPSQRRPTPSDPSARDTAAATSPTATPRARRAAMTAPPAEVVATPRTASRAKRSLGAEPPPSAAVAAKKSSTILGRSLSSRLAVVPSAAPAARKASRPSLNSSTSRPLHKTPSKAASVAPTSSTFSMSTSTRAPPLQRSSSIPIAASGSVRMGKTSSALSSQSIEEKEDDGRSERSGKSSVASSAAMMRPGRAMESAPRPTQATNRSPTRLPTRKPGEALVGPPLIQAVNRAKIEPQPEEARTATLGRSQDQRRESWETLPPSGRPSLSSAAHSSVLDTSRGPSISLSRPNGHSQPATDDFEGDVSWETVESRRASAAAPLDPFFTPRKPTLDQPTISAAPDAADSQSDSTSALPTRANMSYVSPDASTLRHALTAHQLSLVHSSTSPSLTPQNPHARPINPRLVSLSPPELANRLRGRESATLDEILKMSLMSAKKAGEDEEWLYEEGVSQVMRADLEGVSTPWRGSVVVREQGEEDVQRLQEEVEEAKERAALLERDLRAREAELGEERRHNAEEKARVEMERRRWEEEMESLDVEKRRVEAEVQAVALKHADEGRRWEAEREQLAAQSAPHAKATADDPELQMALHLATSSYRQLATLSDGIAERAKGDRDECRTALSSLAVLSEGLRMWEETLGVVMT